MNAASQIIAKVLDTVDDMIDKAEQQVNQRYGDGDFGPSYRVDCDSLDDLRKLRDHVHAFDAVVELDCHECGTTFMGVSSDDVDTCRSCREGLRMQAAFASAARR
jgi:hypothetical protein